MNLFPASTDDFPGRIKAESDAVEIEVTDDELYQWSFKNELVANAVVSGVAGVATGGGVFFLSLYAGNLFEFPSPELAGVGVALVIGSGVYKPIIGRLVDDMRGAAKVKWELFNGIDWSKEIKIGWFNGDPDPPKPPEEPLRMVVEHQRPDERPDYEIIDVPLNGSDKEDNLRRYNEFCIAVLQGAKLTYGEWSGEGKLLTRPEMEKKLFPTWERLGIIQVNSDGTKSLTRQGQHTLRGMLKMQGITPPKLVDTERGVSSDLAN